MKDLFEDRTLMKISWPWSKKDTEKIMSKEEEEEFIKKVVERSKKDEKKSLDKTTGFFRWIIINDKELMDYIYKEVKKRMKEEEEEKEGDL